MPGKGWVSFQEVKQAVSMAMLLDHYGVNWLRKSRDQLRGRCPIHQGEGDRTFHVSLSKDAFNCFSCGAKGNVLDFVTAMESCSVRQAALKLKDWFDVGQAAAPPARQSDKAGEGSGPAPRRTKRSEEPQEGKPAVINPPLSFQLRVDPGHAYGAERGLEPATIKKFGCGLCVSKGMFAGRYVIPLHDEQGRLVGYAGRSIDGSEPKYLFPSAEKGFHKRYLLFNLQRLVNEKPPEDWVVVVEGFFGAMRVSQAGYPCVALLGSSLSPEQEELLCRHFQRVVLLFDGDEAGRRAAEECLLRLGRRLFVREVELAEGREPDVLAAHELSRLLG